LVCPDAIGDLGGQGTSPVEKRHRLAEASRFLIRRPFEALVAPKTAVGLVESCGLQFTAQPEAPASAKAGASGWAVSDKINCPLALCHALIL
jgi:hypothetical protein